MKRHLFTIGGGLAGIALTVALLLTGASAIQGRQSAATPDFALETPDMADVPDADVPDLGGDAITADAQPVTASESSANIGDGNGSGAIEPHGVSVRDIAPEQFGLPEDVTAQPLERIEPRTPLSQPVARPEPLPTVLRHPVALSAGLIQFGGRLLQLDGILPQKADRVCGEAGRTWPCGVIARTALRNFIRARALLCNVTKNSWQGTLTTTCRLNNADPAAWLAESGWAEVPAGSPLAGKVEAARKARLGFFGDDPRTFDTTTAPPAETPLPGDANAGADTTDQGL
ncbi:thermonuclease family protein [Pararhizobium sp. DWP1-1-3]|uniref:thermonuclease family protein n=1 Tax=Pararhizobium sp. DWP1-1-3 TaxID=2804652 RepID=UPI003CF865E2